MALVWRMVESDRAGGFGSHGMVIRKVKKLQEGDELVSGKAPAKPKAKAPAKKKAARKPVKRKRKDKEA